MRQKNYSKSEKEFLITNYSKYKNKELADFLGRSIDSVEYMTRRLKLTKYNRLVEPIKPEIIIKRFSVSTNSPTAKRQPYKHYTKSEVQYVIDNYHKIPVKDIANTLGCRIASVRDLAARNNVTKPKRKD
jgi:hypothetical protein